MNNNVDLRILLGELEDAFNDRIPEAPAHFRPQAVGTILAKLPELLALLRELLDALDKQSPRP